jgi:hypothetical protein
VVRYGEQNYGVDKTNISIKIRGTNISSYNLVPLEFRNKCYEKLHKFGNKNFKNLGSPRTLACVVHGHCHVLRKNNQESKNCGTNFMEQVEQIFQNKGTNISEQRNISLYTREQKRTSQGTT